MVAATGVYLRRGPESNVYFALAHAARPAKASGVCYRGDGLTNARSCAAMSALLQTNLPLPVRRGKVRDVYDLGDRLLLVATDRISAFDWVMPNGIPDKGRILTQISAFWFDKLGVENHLLSLDVSPVV